MRSLVSATSAGALALASSVVLTLGSAAGASAVPVSSADGSSGTSPVALLSTVDGSGQQAALDYWTPQRMADAEPVDRIVAQGTADTTTQGTDSQGTDPQDSGTGPAPEPATGDRSTLAGADAPRVGRGTRSTADVVDGEAVSTGTTWPGQTAGTKKVGRLYFTQGTGKYECTASSVDSPAGNVIVTAGHCLTENGTASTNVVFVPGLSGSYEPYGRWSVTQMYTTEQWKTGDQTSAAALNYDVGFAVVSGKGGKSLKDTVGAFGIDFTDTLSRVTVFGYPGRGTTSDGYTLQYCRGWEFTDVAANSDATTDRATLCNMAGGSSGGPWLRGFDAADGTGTVVSTVSFSYNDSPEVLYGPLFGDVVAAVYREAAGL